MQEQWRGKGNADPFGMTNKKAKQKQKQEQEEEQVQVQEQEQVQVQQPIRDPSIRSE